MNAGLLLSVYAGVDARVLGPACESSSESLLRRAGRLVLSFCVGRSICFCLPPGLTRLALCLYIYRQREGALAA